MYGALTVGGQYAWTRLNRLVAAQGWGDSAEVRILSIVIGLHGLIVYPDIPFYMNFVNTDKSAKEFLELDAAWRRSFQGALASQFSLVSL